jgi:ribosomal protein S18 acetylase RimI-like enzyme
VTVQTGVSIRPLEPSDRGRIRTMTRATGLFRDEEVDVAVEVFDGAMASASDLGYAAAGAELGGELVGWVAWGATPGTVGTYHCYWIVVDPARQGEGIGSALLDDMERRLAGRARLIVVETSGRHDYGSTRAFYARRGYEAMARIPEFYAPGDDQVVFVKNLSITARPKEDG